MLPRLLPCLILLALAACDRPATAPPQPPHAAARPAWNVLMISLDTTRRDHLSCYGYKRPTTPNLDQLARDGHRFDAAYTVMPTTLPAHVAMMTSRYPGQLAVRRNGHILPPEAATLPEHLRDAGFATGGFVSATPIKRDSGFAQGFTTFGEPPRAERPGDQTCDEALAWLARQSGTQPWFCFVHLFDPHTWYTPPAHTAELFNAPTAHEPRIRGFVPNTYSEEALAGLENAYDAEIRFADEQLGRLFDWLDQSGTRARTVILVTADHGETLRDQGRHYLFSHGSELVNWELNVPLLLWLPPEMEPKRSLVHPDVVSLLDLAPTLLDLLDLPELEGARGRSLRPLLAGLTLPPLPALCELKSGESVFREVGFAVRNGDWLVTSTVRGTEAYDLSADPEQKNNLARTQQRTVKTARRMARKLRASLETHQINARPELDQSQLDALETLGYIGDEEDEEDQEEEATAPTTEP